LLPEKRPLTWAAFIVLDRLCKENGFELVTFVGASTDARTFGQCYWLLVGRLDIP
jgi:hypothetical protein